MRIPLYAENKRVILSDEKVEDFRKIYENFYEKEISKEEAYEQGIKLIHFIKEIFKPLTEEELDEIHKVRMETLPQILSSVASQNENEEI